MPSHEFHHGGDHGAGHGGGREERAVGSEGGKPRPGLLVARPARAAGIVAGRVARPWVPWIAWAGGTRAAGRACQRTRSGGSGWGGAPSVKAATGRGGGGRCAGGEQVWERV